MSEITDVLAAISERHARGERMALATIVSVRGSTYRRPGARLLVPEQGKPVGNVSGGCLEGDVERIGREVIASGVPRLELFDLSADTDAVWGYGLGCNGAMEMFIEPADQAAESAAALRTAVEHEQACCLATVIESQSTDIEPGARLLLREDGSHEGRIGGAEGPVADAARRALEAGTSRDERLATPTGELRLFAEVLQPPPRLLVCGAGHDAIPLVRYAAGLGWRVIVADPRPAFLTRERFPEARELLEVFGDELPTLGIDARTYAVVMTHNYQRDMEYLRALLDTPAPYLGMLGPRRRTEQLLAELSAHGVSPADEQRARIYAPAGLDLGAEGPDEVAWSIVAEVLAVQRGRAGGSLRNRRAPIHAPEPEPLPPQAPAQPPT